MSRKQAGLTVAEAAGGRDGTAAEAAATAPTPTESERTSRNLKSD